MSQKISLVAKICIDMSGDNGKIRKAIHAIIKISPDEFY